MNKKRYLMIIVGLLVALVSGSAEAQTRAKHAKGNAIGWREFFSDFPPVQMGMSFDASKRAVLRSELKSVGRTKEELVWDGKFAGIDGRATMFFKPATGAWEVAVIVYALERQKELRDAWRKKIEKRNGPPTETFDDEYAISYVWRFRDGLDLELRTPKEAEGTVVDIHWVKSK